MPMMLNDALLCCPKTKLIYPDHRFPPWLIEDTPRRSNLALAYRRPRMAASRRRVRCEELPLLAVRRLSITNRRFAPSPTSLRTLKAPQQKESVMEISAPSTHVPWNKGKLVGQKT